MKPRSCRCRPWWANCLIPRFSPDTLTFDASIENSLPDLLRKAAPVTQVGANRHTLCQAQIMAPWDYSNSTDIFGSDARRGSLVFMPEESSLSQGAAALGRVAVEYGHSMESSEFVYLTGTTTWGATKQIFAHIDRDFRGPNIPPGKAHAADLDVIAARLREHGIE